MRDDEAALTAAIIAFATEYGRYGYRRIAAMLRDAGWVVNIKRVERIWRREGLKVPQKQRLASVASGAGCYSSIASAKPHIANLAFAEVFENAVSPVAVRIRDPRRFD